MSIFSMRLIPSDQDPLRLSNDLTFGAQMMKLEGLNLIYERLLVVFCCWNESTDLARTRHLRIAFNIFLISADAKLIFWYFWLC